MKVLQCGPLLLKLHRSALEACGFLRKILELSPSITLPISIQNSFQELQCAAIDRTSDLIELTLKEQKENTMPSRQHTVKIMESLGLTSGNEILVESIALEKEKLRADEKDVRNNVDINLIHQLIGLVKHIKGVVVKSDQFGVVNGVFIPTYFRCPLSLQIMFDPVLLASGQTFERSFIQKWLDHGLRVCPKTHQNLRHINLVPNNTVKGLIENWSKENGILLHHYNGHRQIFRDMENEVEEESVGFSSSHDGRLAIKEHDSSSSNHPNVQDPDNDYQSDSVSSLNSSNKEISESPNLLQNNDLSPQHLSSTTSGSNFPASAFCIEKLIEDLRSSSSELQESTTLKLRLLTKDSMENRTLIAQCGAISLLISLLHSTSKKTQENAVTSLMNLSIHNDNKTTIVEAGAIEPLIYVLKYGNPTARENSAASLFSLSSIEEYKIKIGQTNAVRGLVNLLGSGSLRGKKDAAAALFNLSILHENKIRIIQAGAVRYLVELLDPEKGMVDKAIAVLANLSTVPEGRSTITQEGGIPSLVEIVESGTQRGKENAAFVLSQLCINSTKFCNLVLQEGAVPPLIALTQLGTPRAKEKVLIEPHIAILTYLVNLV